jgi:C4-dicarboxylate-specific signal transduction histidine kinase
VSEPGPDAKLEPLLEVMVAIARQDFAARAPVDSGNPLVDAVAVGLNMLAEELRSEVTSRRELEKALAELRQAEARLVHAGKLAAIGQLAAGVAHEINNPIQGVEACLAILQRTHAELLGGLATGDLGAERARTALSHDAGVIADARAAIARVRSVTDSLRTFARADDEALGPVAMDEVIRLACRLSESTARQRARLELALAEGATVHGRRGRLGQVVTNLLVNAIQAVPEGAPDRHRIRVGTRVAGGSVVLSVEDSGPGVPAALRDRILEPFFTTKTEDVGLGRYLEGGRR